VWKRLNQNWKHFYSVEPLTFDRSQSASTSSDFMALYKWFYLLTYLLTYVRTYFSNRDLRLVFVNLPIQSEHGATLACARLASRCTYGTAACVLFTQVKRCDSSYYIVAAWTLCRRVELNIVLRRFAFHFWFPSSLIAPTLHWRPLCLQCDDAIELLIAPCRSQCRCVEYGVNSSSFSRIRLAPPHVVSLRVATEPWKLYLGHLRPFRNTRLKL